MKLAISQKNNLSLQLVTFLAAVFTLVLSTVIGQANAQNSPETLPNINDTKSKLDLSSEQPLIAQTWSSIEIEDLSLATDVIKSEQFSDGERALDTDELIISQLNSEERQLIAQTWSSLEIGELSLATKVNQPEQLESDERALDTDELIISQLNPEEQQLIAQTWSSIKIEDLSLATTTKQPKIVQGNNLTKTSGLLISQVQFDQDLVAQTWKDIDITKLSLAEPYDSLKPSLSETISPNPPEPQRKPIIDPPDQRKIAALIALEKVQIISPAPGVILDKSQNDNITIQYPPKASVQLKINGKEIGQSLITQRELDSRRNLITQTWSDANLQTGTNTLSIIASKDGVDTETKRQVTVKDTSNIKTTEQNLELEDDHKPSSSNQGNSSQSQSKSSSTRNSKPSSNNKPKNNEPPVKILTPKANAVLDSIHSSVIIQYPQNALVVLQVNGQSVDTAQVGRTEVNSAKKLVTQTWYGIIFSSGFNTLSILASTDGTNYEETSIQVTVPGKPEALKVKTLESEIPADGQAIATIQGGFIDKQGTITPWNEIITLNSSAGKFIGTDLEPDIPGFQVKPKNGEFTATLQAGYDAKNVRIQAKTSKFEAYTRTKFKTTLREETLLTGFADVRIGARGTNYYDSFRDFLPTDEDNGGEVDFTAAAFLTGSFGQWSYTGAFNSDRALNEDSQGENRLFQTYSSLEQDYPIYGDSSTTEATTPSIDNVYFRLERNPKQEFAEADYFMWGDYNTEEFSTASQEFSSISRQLHGFKSNYNLGNFQLNALVAGSTEAFQRDTIAPDGTSGFYFLSRRLLVPGSEDVYLELSDFNDPGNVVSRQRLSLGTDYEIDYDRGTLLFKDPVLRTEIDAQGNILVRRIVTTYQFESEGGDSTLFAGRGRYHFNRDVNRPSWLGGTYLNEDRGDQDFALWGLDAYVSVGDWGDLTAEYAQSENETVFANAEGAAYRLEGKVRFNETIQGSAYYRQAEEGFANDATFSFVPGQTRYGSQIQAQVAKETQLKFSYEHQDNKGVAPRPLDQLEEFLDSGFDPVPGNVQDNSLSTITAGVDQKFGESELGVDLTWRDRTDRKSPGDLNSTSTQLRSRFSTPIIGKLNFNALNDLTISDDTDAVFSDRIGLGLDWEFYSGLSLVLNHQWFTKGNLAGESLTSFGIQGEYEPWANATLTGKYTLANGIDGINNIGSMGLQQKISIASGLDLDLNYEHTFSGLDSTGSGVQFSQPFAVGQGASALSFGSGTTYGVGIAYTDNPDFTASAKWQHSDNVSGGNTVVSGNITGKLSSALTSLISYNQASSANQEFDIGTTRNLRLGLAYRDPKQDKFNALFRYEYEENGGLIPESLLLGRGSGSREHLFGLEGIYSPNWRWEFYGKYAFRNDKTFIADDFESSSNISLGQIRARYRFNYHMDFVAGSRAIWQPSAEYTETGIVLEAGYYLTPELRLSAGYVFGNADDEDFTGTRSAGGPYLGMTVKLNSLLDGFGQHSPPSLPAGVSKKTKKKTGSQKINSALQAELDTAKTSKEKSISVESPNRNTHKNNN